MPLAGANLSTRGQNQRLRLGIVLLTVGLALTVALVKLQVEPLYRLGLFVPFFMASFTTLQGLCRTCPMHSRQGTRETEQGPSVPMESENRVTASRALAAKILGLSTVVGIAATASVMLIP